MDTDEDRPYLWGDKAIFLSPDALERAGIEELSAYREALLAEMTRVETEVIRKRAQRDRAKALFKR